LRTSTTWWPTWSRRWHSLARRRTELPLTRGQQQRAVDLRERGGAEAAQLAPLVTVLFTEKRDRLALVAVARGPSDPMGEPLRRLGKLEVDDQAHIHDVDTARRDVGGDQHLGPVRAERIQGAVSGILRQVALQLACRVTHAEQVAYELLGSVLGAMEDDCLIQLGCPLPAQEP